MSPNAPERLDTRKTDDGWVAEGEYRQDGKLLEKCTITRHSGREYRIASFDVEVQYTESDYGSDQVREYLDIGEVSIPGVDSITYRVYLDNEGFHVDVTDVEFDWDGADDAVLQELDSFFSDDGLTAPVPGPQVRLPREAQKTTLETYENLLFTLEHLEPAIPATA